MSPELPAPTSFRTSEVSRAWSNNRLRTNVPFETTITHPNSRRIPPQHTHTHTHTHTHSNQGSTWTENIGIVSKWLNLDFLSSVGRCLNHIFWQYRQIAILDICQCYFNFKGLHCWNVSILSEVYVFNTYVQFTIRSQMFFEMCNSKSFAHLWVSWVSNYECQREACHGMITGMTNIRYDHGGLLCSGLSVGCLCLIKTTDRRHENWASLHFYRSPVAPSTIFFI